MKKVLFLVLGLLLSLPVWADMPVTILSQEDKALYLKIFEKQKEEDWKTADSLIKKLKDQRLMGYVLSDRYFSKTWVTKTSEIENWFKKYSDHPQAVKMYALGERKKAKLPKKKPAPVYGTRSGTCSYVYRPEPIDALTNLSFSYLSKDKRKKAQKIMGQIVRYIKAGRTLNARQLIESADARTLFNQRDHDAARIALAFSYFLDGMDQRVVETAQKAVERSGDQLPLGHWTLGLSYWRQGQIKKAAYHFDKVAYHKKAYPLLKSAGAYWASRASLKLGNFSVVNSYLEIAAENPRNFYGILATHSLGRDLNHTWEKPALPSDDVTESFSHPTWERVIALKEVGRDKEASQELSALFLKADKDTQALLSVAAERNGLASDLRLISGQLDSDEQRYPAPDWTPETGWQVDRALVFAFIKQESCFNQDAQSSVGALGVMQLMPDNARYMAQCLRLDWDKKKLTDPEYNMALGQNYLQFLMKDKKIGTNLLFVAVAYNSGPGSLYRLKQKMKYNDDPLLFIESIPFRETRGFVERIMANYWIYRTLMNQPIFSMDSLIEGRWPEYISWDDLS